MPRVKRPLAKFRNHSGLTVQKNNVIFNQDNESIVSDHFGVEVVIQE
ncbi:hypothetical protein [Tetragenococcus osmophilus]|nr:hypothetical protein [Tetragenococcus osmophilus]